jgi:choline dehydrogenase-like flavoprotein
MEKEYDYIIIGSCFGGSVASLRLSEKGPEPFLLRSPRKRINKRKN